MSLPAFLGLTIAGLVGAHYAVLALGSGLDVDTKGALSWLDLFQERSAGTWVNSLLLAAVAAAAAALALSTPRASGRLRRGWIAFACLVAAASLDEVAGLHESVVEIVRSAVDLPGALYYAAWVLPALALVAAFLAWQWRFFRLLPRRLAVRIGLAAGAYVAAAIGLEIAESELFSRTGGRDWTPVLQVLVGIEEGVEMGAAALILLALVRHLSALEPDWLLSLSVVPAGVPGATVQHLTARPARAPVDRPVAAGAAEAAPAPAQGASRRTAGP